MSLAPESSDFIDLPGPDDFHVHLRQGPALTDYARTLSVSCSRALVMPNTVPPVASPETLEAYRKQIREAAPSLEPLLTFKLLSTIDPDSVPDLKRAGAVAAKYYPTGVTTNAQDGVRDLDDVRDVLSAVEEEDLVLCVHAETPESDILDRERDFLPIIEKLTVRYPSLRIVVEHVSDATTVDFVNSMPPTVAATITVHHLLYSIEDLLGSGIRPHLYCKPLLKKTSDRDAIQGVVLSGNERFFYGSDSAPHPQSAKENSCGAAGVYSAPTAIPLLIDFFEGHDALDRLSSFTGLYGSKFYRLPPPSGSKRFVRAPWRVPPSVDGVVPLAAGETLSWRIDADASP